MNLLLIDDNIADHLLFEECIHNNDNQRNINNAFGALDGLKCLENMYNENKLPSLIITDLHMPEVDGLELLNILKMDIRFSSIPVVLLTISSYIQTRHEEIGIPIFIKPFDSSEYEKVVERMLGYAACF